MGAGETYEERDRQAARNFAQAARAAGVRRIVYLGGLGDDVERLSPHLRSRQETGDALRAPGVPSSSSAPRSSSARAACRSR